MQIVQSRDVIRELELEANELLLASTSSERQNNRNNTEEHRDKKQILNNSKKPVVPAPVFNHSTNYSANRHEGNKPYKIDRHAHETFIRGETYRDTVRKIKDSVSFLEVTSDNRHRMIKRVMTPFHHLEYPEQLELKRRKNEEMVLKILKQSGQDHSSVEPVIPSPVQSHYRTKDEFSVHTDVTGNEKTVGFFVGSPSKGLVCVEPDQIDIIKPGMWIWIEMYKYKLLLLLYYAYMGTGGDKK